MIIDAHIHPNPIDDFADNYKRLITELDENGIGIAIASDLGDWSQFPEAEAIREANDRMLAMFKMHAPRLRYLIYLNPQLLEWENELLKHHDSAVGVKLWISLKDSNGSLLNTEKVLQRAAELRLPVLLHVYDRTDANLPGEIRLAEFQELCLRVPECTMIGAHAGGNWRLANNWLAELPPNKFFDISGGYPENGMVEKLVRDNGADRIVFGSDAVGRSFASQLAKVKYAKISQEEKDLILWQNSARIFRLKPTMVSTCSAASYPWPEWGEDHYCFCGGLPGTEYAVELAELAKTLARYHVKRGYVVNLNDIFDDDLNKANMVFAAQCHQFDNLSPLAITDPRRNDDLGRDIWVSPYLHDYRLDDPGLLPFWRHCSERGIKIWINAALADWRFRDASLKTRQVSPEEIRNFLNMAPKNIYTFQGIRPMPEAGPEIRFELSRLSDGQRATTEFFAVHDGSGLVWGSEYPFRDYPQVYETLTHKEIAHE